MGTLGPSFVKCCLRCSLASRRSTALHQVRPFFGGGERRKKNFAHFASRAVIIVCARYFSEGCSGTLLANSDG